MKVLFVSSGNKMNGIGVIVRNQGESLVKAGIDLDYFTIRGRGISGYLKNVPELASFIHKNQVDIIHAHYSLSAFVAALSTRKPVVASLMGSDIRLKGYMKYLIRAFSRYQWDATIVKSERMRSELQLNRAFVIPNGVDLDKFDPIPRNLAQAEVGFDPSRKHIIFLSDPSRKEKNFDLAAKACRLLDLDRKVDLHAIHNVDHSRVSYYLYAADVLLLTSVWEGSPNAVKEALACNLPVVATDVGDIGENIRDVEGCFLTGFDPVDVASGLNAALDFGRRTNGRKIIEDRLSSGLIASEIIDLYKKVLVSGKIKQ